MRNYYEPVTAEDLARLADTLTQAPYPRFPDTSLLRAKQGPTRCRNCNQPMTRFCRKCNGNTRIQTQGRTRK